MTRLTTARWYLDRVPSLDADESRRSIQQARDICDEVRRRLAALGVSPDRYNEAQMTLDELRARLRATQEI